MRAESFNLELIWLWTQESFLSRHPPLIKQSTFHVFPGCCCKSSESPISGSNFSKIQFLGSKPKGMKVKRSPSTSHTLTNQREFMWSLTLLQPIHHFQLSGTLEVLYLPDFKQFHQSTSVYMFKVFSNQISSAAMGKSWDLSFHFLEKQMSIARSRTLYSDNREEKKHLLSVISKPHSTSKFKERLYPITFPFKIN